MKKILIYLMMIIGVMFMSCTEEPVIVAPTIVIAGHGGIPCYVYQPYQTNEQGQYVIGGYVAGANATRAYEIDATNDVLADYNQFSLFMWTKDSVLTNSSGSMFNGVLSTTQNSWGYTESKKYFDNNQDSYAFLGVFPYETTYTLNADSTVDVPLMDFVTEGIDVNAQKYNKEFIVANNTVNKADYATGATLAFEHQNSIIRIKFETDNINNLEIIDFTPYNPGTPATEEVKDTVDTWISLNRSTNAIGSATRTRIKTGETWGDYTTAFVLPDNLVEEIKSYYSIDNGNPGDYDLHLGNSVWPSGTLKQLRVVKPIPAEYKKTVELYNTGIKMDFFDGFKYLMDNGYDIQPNTSGGKQEVWTYILIDAFVNGAAYTVVGFNFGNSSSIPEYTINTLPGQPAIPATGKEGILVLPATSTLQTGKDAVLSTFPETVIANVGLNGVTYTVDTNEQEIVFTKPGTVAYSIYSPTNWYTFPVTHANDFGFTIKFSYTLNGVTRYDARVFVPAAKCNWQPGKWYDYVIRVNSDKYGKTDPTNPDVDPTDPKIEEDYPIIVNSSVNNYTNGESHVFNL